MSNEWYTPSKYIEAARQVMGSIDLDPASCEQANQTVKATRYYTQENNGLVQEWHGNVWLNPPFSKNPNAPNDRRSNIIKWIAKAVTSYQIGSVNQAVLLVTAHTHGKWFPPLWEYPICFTDHCVRFYLPDGSTNSARPGRKTDGHMHGTIFVYMGWNEQAFIDVFSQFGRIAKAVDVKSNDKPKQLELIS